METITFTCEVITPMFLAGADGITPELRPASIKGALRFWWRAMNGHLVEKDGDLTLLKTREAEIFGGSGEGQGRSKILIRVKHNELNTSSEEFKHNFFTYDGNRRRQAGKAFPTNPMYYLGFGVSSWIKEKKSIAFVRSYILPKTKFEVTIKGRPQYIQEAIVAFKALEQFGGLGAKSRNAYGCFKIIGIETNIQNFVLQPLQVNNLMNNDITDFSSFSSKSVQFITKSKFHKTWDEAFKDLCIAYQYARQNVEEWHRWNKRELIGLPIVVKDEREIEDNFIDRHSKPYFLHISRTDTGYTGEIILLPYNYLKNNPDVDVEYFESNKRDYFETLEKFNKLLVNKLVIKK